MTKKLKILLTNHHLAERAGTQLYIRDLALELQKMGHFPFVYCPLLGEVANELRNATITVVSDLAMLPIKPDIIHGHHQLETLAALLHFPTTPALFVCHGWFAWEEAPPKFPRILRYVAIDQLTYQRIVMESGIPESSVRFLFNFVDLELFKPRPSLPTQLRKALIYSNYIEKNGGCFQTIQNACHKLNIEVDLIGSTAGNPTAHPEQILLNYDIVFAVGRSAMEALATGAAVIIYSGYKMGPLVTTANFEQMQKMNFGLQALERTTTCEAVLEELSHYDPSDAKNIYHCLQISSSKTSAAKAFVDLYQEILEIPYQPDAGDELQAVGRYLHYFSKDFQANLRELSFKKQKVTRIINLYYSLLKFPLLGRACKALKKIMIG